jgi:hypothetical protein
MPEELQATTLPVDAVIAKDVVESGLVVPLSLG